MTAIRLLNYKIRPIKPSCPMVADQHNTEAIES